MNFEKILEVDAHLSNQMHIAEKPGLLRTFSAFLAHSGDSWFWVAGLIILWFNGDTFWKKWAVVIFCSISVLAAMVLVIKFTVKRRRPEGVWGLLYRSTDPHSFPSGHAARALLIGTMAVALGPAWLGAILAVWGPLVALARVAMGVHYLSDVIAGAILGIVVGLIGLSIYEPLLAWVVSVTGFPLW